MKNCDWTTISNGSRPRFYEAPFYLSGVKVAMRAGGDETLDGAGMLREAPYVPMYRKGRRGSLELGT